MAKKNNIKLLITLLVLIAITVIVFLSDSSSDRSFSDYSSKADTATITEINIYDNTNSVVILKDNETWYIDENGKKIETDQRIIKNLLGILSKIKNERVVSTDYKRQAEFQVADSSGLHVIAKSGNEISTDIIIGRFDYKQVPGQNANGQPNYKATSYVRKKDDNSIYAVNGFLKMIFHSDKNEYLYKNIVDVNPNDITKIEFKYPSEKSFNLIKKDNIWKIDEEIIDSTNCSEYLKNLSRLMSGDFIQENLNGQTATFEATISGNNFLPITVKGFGDGIEKLSITSSINKNAIWDGIKNGAASKIFVEKDSFESAPKSMNLVKIKAF